MKNCSTLLNDGKSLGISILLFLGLIFAITLSGGRTASAQAPDFGPNVTIISPSMTETQIETALTNIANDINNFSTPYTSNPTQSQFSTTRNAILFMPGAYTVKAPVGYYESIAGLGATPGAVTITGYLSPEFGAWTTQGSGNGPQASIGLYFWRSMENLTIDPLQDTQQNAGANTLQWGVSQAAPLRRIQVNGSLELTNSYCGSASGGFISNTVVTGNVNPCSQQQWYTRNSTLGSWSGGVWNMVFSGVQGAPVANYPSNSFTVLPTTPVSREKPFLYVDGSGNYNVFVPMPTTNTTGTTWANASGTNTSTGSEPGYSLPISSFFIAQPPTSTDSPSTLAQINAALAAGQNLILTPGIYEYSGSINITNPNTIVLGMGYATLIPQTGTPAITVADVDGVQIAGLIIDAGPVSSPVLLQIGVYGASRVSHASNPITINDVFFRIGGAEVGTAATSMEIDSDNVILDDIWAWRADHGAGSTPIWTGNAGTNGVVVNGDNVTALGLAVEHYEEAQVVWNGNGGETIFYQSELPYDVPSQSSWMDGSANGYPSYTVSNSVTSHTAYGLGVYSYFDQGIAIVEDNAITVPTIAGVDVYDAVSVFLSGSGQITNTIDNVGTVAKSGSMTSYVPFYGGGCATDCPAAATNLQAFAISPTQVNLAWTASSTPGVYYNVYRSTTSGFTPSYSNVVASRLLGTSYVDTNAVASTTYYYLVVVEGTTEATNQATATTLVNNGEQISSYVVSIDSGCLNATSCNNTANKIPTTAGQNWQFDTSTYLSGTYSQSVKTATITNLGTVNQVPNAVYNSYTHGGPFTYTITGLTPEATYIVALDFNENYVQTGTGYTCGGKVGYRKFNVAINGVQVLTNFDIYANADDCANYGIVQSFYTAADATGTITILFSNGSANSPTVNGIQVGTGTSMPAAYVVPPSGLSASTASDAEIDLGWSTSSTPNVVYEVFRSTTSGFTPSASNVITTTTGTSFADTTVSPSTTYYYLVEASDSLFTSQPSNQGSASTSAGSAPPAYGSPASIAEVMGYGQTAAYGTDFTAPLTVIVQDANGNLVPDASVTFAGTGVSFPSGNTVSTNSIGQAQITAQPSAIGALTVTASVTGVSTPTSFSETGTLASTTVTVNCPSSVTYNGSAQTPCTASVTGVAGLNQSLTVNYSNNINAGAATASANFAGDANDSSSSNSAGFTINQASQTINFPQPVSTTLVATGGASGNPVTFSVISGPGSVSGTNGATLSFTGVGTVVVAANQAGNANYSAAPTVTVSIQVVNTATLISPAQGSTFGGSSQIFIWNPASGATGYILYLGSTGVGSNNLLEARTTATTVTANNLPVNGETIYARLWTNCNGVWKYNDYTFTAAAPAALTSPTQGATFAGSSQSFTWNSVGGATGGYTLFLGSTGVGSNNLLSAHTTATTVTANNLPVNGETIYARLWTICNGVWTYNDYTFTAAGPAALISPTQGATFAGSSQSFTWNSVGGATGYNLFLGSTGVGSNNLLNAHTTATSVTANNLPVNGETIYARLWTNCNGAWTYNDYTFTAAAPAALSSPTQGATFAGSSQSFTWNSVVGATGYTLFLGSTGVGSNNLLDASTTATTITANNLPVNGETIYARLWTNCNGVWTSNDYTFTAE
jgi:hypothetical protein